MPEDRVVTFRLPADTLARLADAARQRDCAPADLIRTAISTMLAARCAAPVPSAAVIAALIRTSPGWHDLQRSLRQNGAVLRTDGCGTLWLHSWPADRPLGPAGLWNIDHADLVLRFGAPFPGATRSTGQPVVSDVAPAATAAGVPRVDRVAAIIAVPGTPPRPADAPRTFAGRIPPHPAARRHPAGELAS